MAKVKKVKVDNDPHNCGYYDIRGPASPSPNLNRRAIWYYNYKMNREYHMDIYDGDKYIGHITFRAPFPRTK